MRSAEAPIFHQDPDGRAVLVTGANGSMGRHYVERLAKDTQVNALARRDEDVKALSQIPNVKGVKGDVTDLNSMRRVTENVGTIFHLATNLSLTDWDTNLRVNKEGTENLAQAANENGVDHVHLVSSVAACGGGHTEEFLTEKTPHHKSNAYGDTKWMQELIVFDGSNRFTASAIRPVNVIGDDIDVWTGAIVNVLSGIDVKDFKIGSVQEAINKLPVKLRPQRIKIPEPLLAFAMTKAIFAYVDIDNAIDLSIEASQNPKAVGEVFNAVDGNATWGEILNAYARGVLDQKTYKFSKFSTNSALGVAELATRIAARITGKDEIEQGANYLFRGQKYSTEKADTVLAHNHRVSLKESVANTKRYVDEHGQIRSKKIYK